MSRRIAWLCLVLAAAAFLQYARVWGNGFVTLDDEAYVVRNPHLRDGLEGSSLMWAFGSSREGNWHPLTWLSHALDVSLFGLDPRGHHLTSIFLHAVNTVLLFLFLSRATKVLWGSAAVAALFAIHPLRVESVAWVAERKDVLSGTFFMLTLLLYVGYTKRPGVGRYLSVVAALACGLMAKPMLVTVPFLLLLLDVWPLGRFQAAGSASTGRLLLEKVPLLALSGASCLLTFAFQVRSGAVDLGARLANALLSYAWYLEKTIWPSKLAVLYPHPALLAADRGASLIAPAIGAGVLLLAVSALVGRSSRTRPYLLVGWLWYLGTLVPVIGLVQVGMQSRADRYAYLPLIGIYIVIVWGVRDLARRFSVPRPAVIAAAAVVLGSLASVTWAQIGHWRDSVTLYERALAVTSGNYVVHNNLGVTFQDQGKLDESRAQLEEALRLAPDYAEAHNNLAWVLEKQGDLAGAKLQYEAALLSAPQLAQAHLGLAAILQRQGDAPRAIVEFEAALGLQPDDAKIHNDLGVVLASRGAYARAREHLERALRLDPALTDAYNNLATIALREGDLDRAVELYGRALALKPDSFESRYNLALALRRKGDLAAAAASLEEALRLRPGDPRAGREYEDVLRRMRSTFPVP